MDFAKYIDLAQPDLWISVASIAFNPIFWNIVARKEYETKFITRIFGGNPYYGCYALAVVIFSLGVLRDVLYSRALDSQPKHPLLDSHPVVKPLAGLLLLAGNTLVVTSMWALGVTGTYLGDYFGILMDTMVTGFPFSVCSCPMYLGSWMCFVAGALFKGSLTGLLLTVEVGVGYILALRYEDPFTAMIYERRDREKKIEKKDM